MVGTAPKLPPGGDFGVQSDRKPLVSRSRFRSLRSGFTRSIKSFGVPLASLRN